MRLAQAAIAAGRYPTYDSLRADPLAQEEVWVGWEAMTGEELFKVMWKFKNDKGRG